MAIAFRSKNEVVYETLRQAIIRGEYKPGSRLVIDELAVSLGVSQIPIREAIRQLEADGFVTIAPYVGATITEINADFIFEIFALLESLEVICSRMACRMMSDEDLAKMDALITNMDALVDKPEQWSQENKEFHLFICAHANTALTYLMMRNVLDHWDRLRLHYLKDVFGHRIQQAQAEHQQILTAFQLRNVDEVERVVREHNHNAFNRYFEHLQSTGQVHDIRKVFS